MLIESLDEIYPLQRVPTTVPYIMDEWQFEVNSVLHVIRFHKIPQKRFGKRVCRIEFGVKKGKTIRKKLGTVPEIRKYLSTVLYAIKKSKEEPTRKLKNYSDGFIVAMERDVFEKSGLKFQRILRTKFKGIFKTHKSYFNMPDDSERNALYIWKKEKTFNVVFSNLGIEDDSDDDKPSPVRDLIKDTIKSKLDVSSNDNIVDAPIEKSDTPAPANRSEKSIIEKVSFNKRKAISEGGVDLSKRKPNINSYLKVAIVYAFFTKSFSDTFIDEKTSLDSSTVNITKEDFLNYIQIHSGLFSSDLIPSGGECLLALNAKGIKTSDIYDNFRDNFDRVSEYEIKHINRTGFDYTTFRNRLLGVQVRKNVSLEEILDICLDAKNILREFGTPIDSIEREKYARKFKDKISPNRIWSSMMNEIKLPKSDKVEIFNSLIASIDPSSISSIDPFTYKKSSKDKKIVKSHEYSYKNASAQISMKASDLCSEIWFDDPAAYSENISKLPYFAQGIYSEDLEFFETSFIFNWTLSGSSTAQIIGHETFNSFGVNKSLDAFYHSIGNHQEYTAAIIKERKDIYEDHLQKLYERSQEYYKKKYKGKYDTKTIKLYRGIGANVVDTYVPGSLESWSATVSTAVRFGKMMDRGGTRWKAPEYTILMAEVPIKDIFGSWDSFDETWPGEEDLKGKKEYIVMGGTFSTTPIYIYDAGSKSTIKQVKPFTEWIEEAMEMKKKSIKIVTPTAKDFEKILKSNKTALGNDPREEEIRKTDKKEG